MALSSSIEWTDATWNPVAGCTPVSAGCLNCYAARMALRLSHVPGKTAEKYGGTARRSKRGLPVFSGQIVLDREALGVPLSWRKPRLIFVNSMSDVFHEKVPAEYVAEIFDVMERCPQHTFQVLTKRPERAAGLASSLPWPSNVWFGTSVESAQVKDRITHLRKVPAAVRFLSCEPLLGPLPQLALKGIGWVIVGGESGPGARPMNEEWVRQIRDQCVRRDVPFFFKQWGGVQKKRHGRTLDNRTWDQLPVAVAV
ncbi:MAG: phage Gp37/Gp68 family protein [Planctomycetota bacterium]